MKTKSLLTAMALPLVFAACSQEELVNENNATNLGARKVVGEVSINLDEEGMSRMAFVGGENPYQWEAGDQFGACLMDVPANGAAMPNYSVGFWNRYDLVDYVHTNYPFTRQADGSWTSEAVMSEGNYFFYYPYNNNLGGRRSALKVSIPTQQVLADGAKASSALDQQLFVGYHSVQAKAGKEKESLSLKMEPLLAFPGFRLKSSGNSTEEITVYKIAFNSGEETFPVEYEIMPANAEFDCYSYENKNETAATKRANIVKIAKKSGEANQVSLTFGENGKSLKAGQSTLGYIMLPPTTEAFESPELYIYTDKGLGKVDLKDKHVDAGTSPTNISNDRELTTFAYNDASIVNIEFDNTAFAQPFAMKVRSTDELVHLVRWSKNNTKANLTAELVGDGIVLDKEVIDILKASASKNWKLSLTIKGNKLTIPENTSNDALLQNLTLKVNTVVVSEGVNVKVPALTEVKLVENYGTVELVSNTTTPNFYNEGTINITGEWNGYYYASNVAAIENWGVVNVNSTTTGNSKNTIAVLQNKYTGKAYFNSGRNEVLNVTNDFYDNYQSAYKRGEITVASGATLLPIGSNRGLVINNGAIEGALKNEAANTDYRNYVAYTVPSEIQNAGSVEGITNFGLVTMTAKTANLTSATAINGEVNNNVESPYVSKVEGETVFVEFDGTYSASEVAAKVKASNAKELRLSGVLNADPAEDGDGWSYIIGEQAALDVVADGDLTINGQICFYSKDKKEATKFIVKAGTTTDVATDAKLWLGNGELIVNGKLNINSGATVKANVADKTNVKVYGTLINTASSSSSTTTPSVSATGYKNVNGVYEVYDAEGLFAIASDINEGELTGNLSIKLMNNINLNQKAWTPIGQTQTINFNGTIDGNGKTIYGLNVKVEAFGGLIGYGVADVKNLTIDGAEVTGNNWVGAIAGKLYGNLSGCSVYDAKVTADYKNKDMDGGKAGSLVGLYGENTYSVENCKAENCIVTASKDAGQLVGAKYNNTTISNSNAVNVTVKWNGKGTGANINNELFGRQI